MTRADRPEGVLVGRAAMVVRIVGMRLTPTTIEIIIPISTATNIGPKPPVRVRLF